MNNLKPRFKAFFTPLIKTSALAFAAVLSIATPNVQAQQTSIAGDDLMTITILGAVGTLAYSCYIGQAPCSADPDLNTDKLTFSVDNGVDGAATHWRLGIGADWNKSLYEGENWRLAGRLEASLHSWDEKASATYQGDSGYIIGITPVFHYELKNWKYTPFIEMGTGPHLMSQTTVASEDKATQFQFGNILGLGMDFNGIEVGYRYLHISNAGIAQPNPGADFHNLHIGYKF
ncbi:acyloxyacyl hydrolase [Thiomicrorhabdus sediminis]|uniref:Acyloxyacyl hydrolase n=1 Tax=Thiomicrorhabdus sediminis TaxID=2580412 RepID=A0A4P9K4A5_9GAMM|nr:acyloxyacyl hydrolase [Thiomicrorhabdus sediminis]QCU89531.1 acyloxyacyl hydrolase [Thiomicrorhabdus sediminis]